ncbi:unnamed protein product [Symbiodinium microadriaticum]|nr:unnamed protein product [Symbiodinium microadriaticum]
MLPWISKVCNVRDLQFISYEGGLGPVAAILLIAWALACDDAAAATPRLPPAPSVSASSVYSHGMKAYISYTIQPCEQESTQESAAEPCCVNEAREGDEGIGEYVYWGYDLKPAMPPAPGVSAEVPLIALEVGLAAVTVVLMGYCSLADPGQLKKTRNIALDGTAHSEHISPGNIVGRSDGMTINCKWVNNVIGLLNHREFVLMLVGLCLIGLFGVVLDGYLAFFLAEKGLGEAEIAVALHLAFSVGLLAIEVPIFKIYIGLVSRNELGQEWKNNLNYVANQTSMGDGIPVEALDDEEYNQLFDEKAFIYDKSRNRWDQGCSSNCWNFWCWPRWPAVCG